MVKEESEIDINWLKGNRMTVNPDKIQTIEIKNKSSNDEFIPFEHNG